MNRLSHASLVLAALITCLGHVSGHAQASGQPAAGTPRLTEQQQRELERIGTLGYTVGGDAAPDKPGVTILEPDAYEGYTVYVSSDFGGAFLVDLEGRVLHVWNEGGAKNWTRAWVYPDGSVLGVSAYPARLIKLDRDSRPLWTFGDPTLRAHHDVRVRSDGLIYALMRTAAALEWLRPKPLLEDIICILESDGDDVREVDRISIPEAFRDSEYTEIIQPPRLGRFEDPFHTNCVEILDGSVPHPAFRSGNILVTIRNIDCLAVIDAEQKKVVWVSGERWQRQHEARGTPNGHVMLFDNRKFEGQSRVVEYDVVADEIVWEYTDEGFYSAGTGAQQLLPNGNVLITESQKGRILEVTRDGRVVWEYWNPRTLAGGETIVRLTRAFRVPLDFFDDDFGGRLRQVQAPRSDQPPPTP